MRERERGGERVQDLCIYTVGFIRCNDEEGVCLEK